AGSGTRTCPLSSRRDRCSSRKGSHSPSWCTTCSRGAAFSRTPGAGRRGKKREEASSGVSCGSFPAIRSVIQDTPRNGRSAVHWNFKVSASLSEEESGEYRQYMGLLSIQDREFVLYAGYLAVFLAVYLISRTLLSEEERSAA